MGHRIQGQGGDGCCPSQCPTCDGVLDGSNFPILIGSLFVSSCPFGHVFELSWNEAGSNWTSGNFTPDCGDETDTWSVTIACIDSVWYATVTNNRGLSSGAVAAIESTNPCPTWLIPWTASGSTCCANGSHSVRLSLIDTIVYARECCACVCNRLCAIVTIPNGGGPGIEVRCPGSLLWQGTCLSDQRWTGTITSCGPSNENIDLTIYLERDSDGTGTGTIGTPCVICLESTCLGLTGNNRLCVPYSPNNDGDVSATFSGIDFDSCLTGLTGTGSNVGTIVVSCGDCPCCDIPDTLTATFASVINCAGLDGLTITLTRDSDTGMWTGSQSHCGVNWGLTLKCETAGDGCNGMELEVTPFSCGFSFARPNEVPACSCEPFEAQWAGGAGIGLCTSCCPDAGPAPKRFTITITE